MGFFEPVAEAEVSSFASLRVAGLGGRVDGQSLQLRCRDRIHMKTSNQWQWHRRNCGKADLHRYMNFARPVKETCFANPVRAALVIILLFGICASLSGCSGSDPKRTHAAEARAVSVAIAPAVKQDVPVYLVGLGSVTAFYTANIKSRVDGQIMRVNFVEGQEVKEGDLLIVIDPRPYQVQQEQMEAQLFKDQASLRDAKLNYDRYVTLIPSGSIAQQQVDTQKATVDQLDGQVRTDQAQIDNAKLNIIYCNITAPFTGRVGLRQVDPGNIVHAADTNPMLILTQLQPIAVIFTLPEDQIPTVAEHMRKATLEVEAYSRDNQVKLETGRLLTIDNQIDQTTGTAKLKAVFDNKDNKLWPNQFVNANLLLETRKNSTVVPTAALQRGPDGAFVYLVKPGNTVVAQNVTVSLSQGNTSIITAGLNPGDTVVTDGQDKLQTGSRIEPRNSSNPGNNANPAGQTGATNSPSGATNSGSHNSGTPGNAAP
jgi:membrane fusion protein, multidrug efflux system